MARNCEDIMQELVEQCICVSYRDIIRGIRYGLGTTHMDANAREVAYQDILASLNRSKIISNQEYEKLVKEGISGK